MRWRQTFDVDLVVALDVDRLTELRKRPDWTGHPQKEHEFVSPDGAKIDLLPAGRKAMAAGRIEWSSGEVMNMAGLDLAFEHKEVRDVSQGPCVNVAPPHIVALLIMVSFGDRPAERQRDLEDIAHLLDSYVDETSDRRWDEAFDCGEFELAPAYLLGLDVGRVLASDTHRKIVERFLRSVEEPGTYALMTSRAPQHWRS